MGLLNFRELFPFYRKLSGWKKTSGLKLILFSIKLSKLQFGFNSVNIEEIFNGEIGVPVGAKTCESRNYKFLNCTD